MTIDELEKEIRKLSDADKMLLYERLNVLSPPIETRIAIEIDDMNIKQKAPQAILHYPDGSTKVIDILESVKKNAISIGHPAILLAIRRWEQLVRLNKFFFDDACNKKYDLVKERNELESRLNDNIATYLKNIGAALYEGAKEREFSREEAFKLQVETLDIDKQENYLYKAWDLLGRKEFRKIRNFESKLTKLREQLSQEKTVSKPKILINEVIGFFDSTSGRQHFNKHFSWPATRNAFLAWCFSLQQSTVKSYYSRSNKKVTPKQEFDKRFLSPQFFREYSFSEIGDSFFYPLLPRTNT